MTTPATIPVVAPTPTTFAQQGPLGAVAWWCRGPEVVSFTVAGRACTAEVKSGLITSPYATVQDVFDISIAEDQQFDFKQSTIATWLSVGAARINEFLGQRFHVPLNVWSSTIVWANAELAYIGASRRRGINTEAMLTDFHAREEAVISWLKMSRDHEITPDQRLSNEDLPRQALRYLAQPARGWDRESYGVAYNTQANGFGGGGSIGLPTRR